jgi:uncharacterized protein (DUF305 family)
MHRTRITLTALLAALALLAAACNGAADAPETDADEPPATDATGEEAYHDADLEFLRGMVPHHEEAVEMARLVPDRTDRPELNELAEDIIAAQEAEIAQMEQLLADAGADRDGAGHDMDGMNGMEGMMGEEEMERLAGLEGVEFDLAFVDMMIAHHEGAITASERVIAEGQNPQVRQLAEEIIAEQRAEIDQMTTWREQWAAETR